MAIAVFLCAFVWATSLWAQPVAVDKTAYPLDDYLRLNQIQVKGTHNSYHQKPRMLFHEGWNYSHATLYDQLDAQGVRALELDLHLSRDGKRLEVYHIAALDERSTCKEFERCLKEIRDWSDDHADHLPLSIWIEVKDVTGGRKIKNLRRIENAIRRHLGGRLITPDDVKGSYSSLREAIAHRGWPLLGEVRGKMMFVLLNKKGRHTRNYTRNYTSLDGRLMFAKAAADQLDMPWAVLTHLSATHAEAIRKALDKGFIVVATACRAGMQDDECFARRDAAIRNGAHIIKDDFPAKLQDRGYWLTFPADNPVQCNLVTAPDCYFLPPHLRPLPFKEARETQGARTLKALYTEAEH
jgi:hypothetical protein